MTDPIKTASQKPKRASGDQGSVEQQSIEDQIKADEYDAAKAATRRGMLAGIKFAKISSPGPR